MSKLCPALTTSFPSLGRFKQTKTSIFYKKQEKRKAFKVIKKKKNIMPQNVGAMETGLNGNGPKRNLTVRDIVNGRLNLLLHEIPLQFHQVVLNLTQPVLSVGFRFGPFPVSVRLHTPLES